MVNGLMVFCKPLMILILNNYMKVRCVHNTGESLQAYEYQSLTKTELGRFGATAQTEYGLVIW